MNVMPKYVVHDMYIYIYTYYNMVFTGSSCWGHLFCKKSFEVNCVLQFGGTNAIKSGSTSQYMV